MTGISDDQTASATAITATRMRWARQVWRRSGPLITPPPRRRPSHGAVVVVDRVQLEERVLQAGGLDQQVGHRERGDRREQRLRVALQVAGQPRPVDRDRRDAGDRDRSGGSPANCISTRRLRRARSVATSSFATRRPARTTATRSQTRSTSDSTWDENSTVRPARRTSSRIAVEGALHERVEALGGLVEDRELGVVLQGLDDPELLAHAARVVADRPAQGPGVELEAVAQGGAPDGRPAGEIGEVVEVALAGQAVVERDAARQVPRPGADGHRLGDDVPAEHAAPSRPSGAGTPAAAG